VFLKYTKGFQFVVSFLSRKKKRIKNNNQITVNPQHIVPTENNITVNALILLPLGLGQTKS